MAEIVTIWGVPYNADSPAVKKKIGRTVDIYTGSRDPLNLEKFALLCEYVLNKIAELPQQVISIDDAYKAIGMTELINRAHNEPDFFLHNFNRLPMYTISINAVEYRFPTLAEANNWLQKNIGDFVKFNDDLFPPEEGE